MSKLSCRFSISEIPALLDHVLEGTPFVPFAMLLDLMARAGEIDDGSALFDCKVNTPIMLRRNRDRDISVSTYGTRVTMHDEGGNVYASLSINGPGKWSNGSGSRFPTRENPKDSTPTIEPLQLYPRVLFHGPTFQGTFHIQVFDDCKAVVEITEFDSHPASLGRFQADQEIPIVLADLAFQVVGLHLLASRQIYGLPCSCERFIPFAFPVKRERQRALVTIVAGEDDTYDLNAKDTDENEIFRCLGLQFQTLNRPVDPEVAAYLSSLVFNPQPDGS